MQTSTTTRQNCPRISLAEALVRDAPAGPRPISIEEYRFRQHPRKTSQEVPLHDISPKKRPRAGKLNKIRRELGALNRVLPTVLSSSQASIQRIHELERALNIEKQKAIQRKQQRRNRRKEELRGQCQQTPLQVSVFPSKPSASRQSS